MGAGDAVPAHDGEAVADATDWLLDGDVAAPPDPEPPLLKAPYPADLCFASGTPNAYAVRAENRRREFAYFLAMWRWSGDHASSAVATCGAYGHELRGGVCDRCGGRG